VGPKGYGLIGVCFASRFSQSIKAVEDSLAELLLYGKDAAPKGVFIPSLYPVHPADASPAQIESRRFQCHMKVWVRVRVPLVRLSMTRPTGVV
jgi:hypothetical protein